MDKHTYIIASSEYAGIDSTMEEFVGTFHELLLKLCGFGPEDMDETFYLDAVEKPIRDLTDEELTLIFNEGNGDGQAWYMVWDCEKKAKVMG